MKLAVISDIHANLPALTAVLADIAAEHAQRTVCLGDIVGYGGSPNECCDIIREAKVVCVQGNHDLAAVEAGTERWFTLPARTCILWTRAQLTLQNQRLLGYLPATRHVERVTLCHGSLLDPDEYIYLWHEAVPSFQALGTHLGFLGHTHFASWFYYEPDPPRGEGDTMPEAGTLAVTQEGKYLINPGAVGQPRDGNPAAAYALYDDELEEVVFRRVTYDVEAAAAAIIDAGLPQTMAARLFAGV